MSKSYLFMVVFYIIFSLVFLGADEIVLIRFVDLHWEFFLKLSYVVFSSTLIYMFFKRFEKLNKEIRRSREVYRTLIDLSLDGIYIEDERGHVLDCNLSGHKMFGYTKEEMLTKSIKDLVPEEFAELLPEIIPQEMATGDVYVERVNKKKNGTVFSTEINTKFVKMDGENRLIAYVRDISERKKLEEKLIEFATRDGLTNVYNRRSILEKLNLVLLDQESYPISIVMIDLDDFKEINDCFGHIFGDTVLKRVASMLSENIRESDYVGRYGGEEFIVILTNTNLKNGHKLISRLKNELYSMKWDEKKFRTSFSAGIVELKKNFSEANDRNVIKVVDKLLYRAKNNGKNRIEMLAGFEIEV